MIALLCIALSILAMPEEQVIASPLQLGFESLLEMEQGLENISRSSNSELAEAFKNDTRFAAIFQKSSPQLVLWLCREGRYPLVSLLGFFASKERDNRIAFEAALEAVLANQGNLPGLYGPALQQIASVEKDDKSLEVFTKLAEKRHPVVTSVAMVVGALPTEFLAAWLNRSEVAGVLKSNDYVQAFIMDRLAAETKANKVRLDPKDSAKLKELMKGFGLSGGCKLAVYVTHSEVEDKTLSEAISRLIRDEDVDDVMLMVALKRHSAFIKSVVEYTSADISEKRRQLVEAVLKVSRGG